MNFICSSSDVGQEYHYLERHQSRNGWNIYLDEGWSKTVDYFFKGFRTSWCKIYFDPIIRIESNKLRDFPIYYNDDTVSNFQKCGKIVPVDGTIQIDKNIKVSHQDNFYPKSKNSAYVTLNWFLKDADKENGTIFCYPGSHKLGLLPAKDNISFREKVGDNPGSECNIPEEFLDKKTDIIIPGNSIVVLNGNCIHGSYPNTSERSRPWFSSCYISDGEEFVVGNSSKREEIHLSKENS